MTAPLPNENALDDRAMDEAMPAVPGARETVLVLPLGRVAYDEAWALQKALQRRLIDAKRAAQSSDVSPKPPHVLLLVEHPHVYTLGQNGRREHLLRTQEALDAEGAAFVPVDRGGDITYHGPGQMVGYPLLDLDRFRPDLHDYLRRLEEVVMRTLAAYGLEGRRVPGRTGVWIGPDARGAERKACAFGIRCSRWVTMHGWALNVSTDLSRFGAIVPCGIADRGVTSLSDELGRAVALDEATERLLAPFAEVFGARLVRVPPSAAPALAWRLAALDATAWREAAQEALHADGPQNGIVAA